MRKRIFLIFDEEADYACGFAAWMERKGRYPFAVIAFTDREALDRYGKNSKADILLVGEKSVCREIMQFPAKLLVVLQEEGNNEAALELPAVDKYQSCEKIMREILDIYGEKQEGESEKQTETYRKMRILGVYSPVSRCGKTSFSLALGQILAESQAVLYGNLETYSGFEELFSCTYERSLADIFYGIRQKKGSPAMQAAGMIQETDSLHCLPPFLIPGDAESISSQEWEIFIEDLKRNSIYEILLLDMGENMYKKECLAELCSRIYMPVLDDRVSKAKICQMENYLKNSGQEDILDKIRKIRLPKPPDHGQENWMKSLKMGEFGDYVRKVWRDESIQRVEKQFNGKTGQYVGEYG